MNTQTISPNHPQPSHFLRDDWYETLTFNDAIDQAVAWGADQELEACIKWLSSTDIDDSQEAAKDLRAARRPKPSTLKEQALSILPDLPGGTAMKHTLTTDDLDLIRQALNTISDA